MTTPLSNASRFKNARLQGLTLVISPNEKRCVNCENYRPFWTPPRSNIGGWCDTHKGRCNANNTHKTHLEYCTSFEQIRPV